MIIFSNISVFPLTPIILYLSHLTGAIWLGDDAQYISFSMDITWEMMHNYFIQYVIGAVTLSIAAGLSSGLLAYAIIKLTKRSKT